MDELKQCPKCGHIKRLPNLAIHCQYCGGTGIGPLERQSKTDDEAFHVAWTNYMEYDETDWSGLTDEERYISVARHFWQAAIAHERATVREAVEAIRKDAESMVSYFSKRGEILPMEYSVKISRIANEILTAYKQTNDSVCEWGWKSERDGLNIKSGYVPECTGIMEVEYWIDTPPVKCPRCGQPIHIT